MTTITTQLTNDLQLTASVNPVAALPEFSEFVLTECDAGNAHQTRTVYRVVLERDRIRNLLAAFSGLHQDEIRQTS